MPQEEASLRSVEKRKQFKGGGWLMKYSLTFVIEGESTSGTTATPVCTGVGAPVGLRRCEEVRPR